jgi:hypothetical protein
VSEPTRQGSPVDGRVLFIGNSLTATNGRPAMVEALSRQGGGAPPVTAASVVVGGFSLEDHWNQGTAVRRINEGGWSIVVLQQGPSSLPENQASLRDWTARFDAVILANGARTALYMVWPGVESARGVRCGQRRVRACRARLLQEAAQDANAQFGRR